MFGFAAAVFFMLFGVFSADALANVDEARAGLQATGSSGGSGEADVKGIVEDVIDILSFIVGAASVIMIIIGGLKYVTSSGESSNIQSAKNTIIYAIVGLVIVLFAQTIVKFVIDRVAGSTTTVDNDGDGVPAGEDADDNDPSVTYVIDWTS